MKKYKIMIIFFVTFLSNILAEQQNVLIILMDDLGEFKIDISVKKGNFWSIFFTKV